MDHVLSIIDKFSNFTLPKTIFSSSKIFNVDAVDVEKNERIMQNFVIIWLDKSIDEKTNKDCIYTINKLKRIATEIHTFTDPDECIDFITDVANKKICMIVSGTLGEIIVPLIHDIIQIDSIYIFCQHLSKHRQWILGWSKVKCVSAKILTICEYLKIAEKQCEQNSVSISLVPFNNELLNSDFAEINQTFMYTQILKEILLTIQFDKQSMHDFVLYCRERFADNPIESSNVDKFEREYYDHTPIWWYTYECFLYPMLNRALRLMEVDIILRMGFFVRDLHENIVKLHSEQCRRHRQSNAFIVYRGQTFTNDAFNELVNVKGGLLSFNNFLSTSKIRNVSLDFARRYRTHSDLIGVLFVMRINPSLGSTPFASTKRTSCYETEREILFSMHSVFRVGEIQKIEQHNDRLWQVELTLTTDNDWQHRELTERIRRETNGVTGWHRLGQFLIMIGDYIKAENLYKALLHQTNDESEQAHFSHHLGVIKDCQGNYELAAHYYSTSLEINEKILASNHHYIASTYNGLGLVYSKMDQHKKALDSHEKALAIFQKSLASDNPRIAISYGNIGKVYHALGELSNALTYHKKALEIFEHTLPPTYHFLAVCYYDIGNVYEKLGNHEQALTWYEKAFQIRRRTLSPNHPLLAASRHSIGKLNMKLGNYALGISHIKAAINIAKCSLPSDHPDCQVYENNLRNFQAIYQQYILAQKDS